MVSQFIATYPEVAIFSKPTAIDIQKAEGKLPFELIQIWQKFGWGVFMNGFLRLINPNDYTNFVSENIELATPSIPFAVTAFGDLLMYLQDGYIESICLRKGQREIVESGMDLFLNDTLLDFNYTLKELKAEQYNEAVARLGVPTYNQCFGYFPLLVFGGPERVDNLQLADLRTHMEIMAQAVGPL